MQWKWRRPIWQKKRLGVHTLWGNLQHMLHRQWAGILKKAFNLLPTPRSSSLTPCTVILLNKTRRLSLFERLLTHCLLSYSRSQVFARGKAWWDWHNLYRHEFFTRTAKDFLFLSYFWLIYWTTSLFIFYIQAKFSSHEVNSSIIPLDQGHPIQLSCLWSAWELKGNQVICMITFPQTWKRKNFCRKELGCLHNSRVH